MANPLKKPRIFAFLALVLIVIIFGWWWSNRAIQTTDDAYVEADMAVLSPEVQGIIQSIDFSAHQMVKKGDILVHINQDYFKTALDAARAEREKAEASLASAEAAKTLAEINLNRVEQLANTNTSSKQSLDEARANLSQATAGVAEAKSQIELTAANEARAALDVEHCLIRAPFDGRVGESAVQPGSYIQAGMQLVALIPHERYVTANYKETQLAHLKAGQIARLKFDSFPDQEYQGTIESFSPGTGSTFALLPPENATGNFTKIVQRVPVRIRLPDNQTLKEKLSPGLSVEVSIDTSR